MADGTDSDPLPVEKIVEKADPQLLKELEPEQRELVLGIVQRVATRFEGPLPPPEILAEYDRLIPQGAERLMRLLEAQTHHRHERETHLAKSQAELSARGQVIGSGLCLVFGVIGWTLSMNGHDTVAGLLFSTTILGLVTVFVLGRAPQARVRDGNEQARKAKQDP
jgi:uncharacterized membrane protein